MGNQSSKNGPEFYKEFQRATISKDYIELRVLDFFPSC